MLVLAILVAGCGGPPPIHVRVNVVAQGYSGGNVTIQGWDPHNRPVVDTRVHLLPGGNVTVATFDGPAGSYTFRGGILADNGTLLSGKVQEDIDLPKGTVAFYMLASDGGVAFSHDGRTPI
jgi:hypothetical protein